MLEPDRRLNGGVHAFFLSKNILFVLVHFLIWIPTLICAALCNLLPSIMYHLSVERECGMERNHRDAFSPKRPPLARTVSGECATLGHVGCIFVFSHYRERCFDPSLRPFYVCGVRGRPRRATSYLNTVFDVVVVDVDERKVD
ncbi:unnamed protein product, partial [Ectocarpus fasciculatus]